MNTLFPVGKAGVGCRVPAVRRSPGALCRLRGVGQAPDRHALPRAGRPAGPSTIERAMSAVTSWHEEQGRPKPNMRGARAVLNAYKDRLALEKAEADQFRLRRLSGGPARRARRAETVPAAGRGDPPRPDGHRPPPRRRRPPPRNPSGLAALCHRHHPAFGRRNQAKPRHTRAPFTALPRLPSTKTTAAPALLPGPRPPLR